MHISVHVHVRAQSSVCFAHFFRSRSSLERDIEQLREECSCQENRLRELREAEGRERGDIGESGRRGERGREVTDNPLLSVVTETTCAVAQVNSPAHFPTHSPALSPSHVATQPSVVAERANTSGTERVKSPTSDSGEGVNAKSHDLKNEEDWSETSDTVGSMKVEELAPPTNDGLESVRALLDHNHRYTLYTCNLQASQSWGVSSPIWASST